MALNKLFGGFRHHAKILQVKNQLAELQRRSQKNPHNLNLQIRIADLFIKLGKKMRLWRISVRPQKNMLKKAL